MAALILVLLHQTAWCSFEPKNSTLLGFRLSSNISFGEIARNLGDTTVYRTGEGHDREENVCYFTTDNLGVAQFSRDSFGHRFSIRE
jgi:hypothetical protein